MSEFQPPDLHELISQYGSFSAIPPEAWAKFDAEMKAWQQRRRLAYGLPPSPQPGRAQP